MVNSENIGVKDAEPLRKELMNYCTGANCDSCLQNDCDREATLSISHSSLHEGADKGRSVEVYDYVQSGDRMKRVVAGHALLIPLERREFPAKTVFPKKFPVPVVCSEFCGKDHRCNLRENGFSDLCRYRHKLGKLVMPVNGKWYVRFNIRKDQELKARTQFAKSSISGTIPEIALSHERTEDNTFAAYSSQEFLDACDDPEDGHELEYTMDTGMVSPAKSQAGAVPSFMYRITYRDRKILLGFETKRVEKTYVETEHSWVYYPSYGRFILSKKKVIRTTSYREDVPVYKWIRLPTLRPIGCYLKPMKVIGSTTVMTRKEQKFYKDRRKVERQNHRHEKVLIHQDGIAVQKQIVLATC
jgi:hypothetical protein